MNYLIAGIAAFLVATLINYLLSIRYVFVSEIRFSKKKEIMWVYIVSLIGMNIDLFVLYVCARICLLDLMVSKILAIFGVFFWNYWARKHFVFKQ